MRQRVPSLVGRTPSPREHAAVSDLGTKPERPLMGGSVRWTGGRMLDGRALVIAARHSPKHSPTPLGSRCSEVP